MLAAAVALATAWLATPHAVPLYDGIGVPDEPYRYVTPPAGYQKTPAPSTSTTTVPAKGGVNSGDGFYALTKEQSAQFGVFINTGSIAGPATTKTFTIAITPQAPQGGTPGGPVDGNVYQVALLADASPTATVAPADKDSLVMLIRATSAKIANASIYYRPTNGSWTSVPTQRGGTDSWQAYFQGAGQYAVVAGTAASTGSSHRTLIIALLVLVILAMAAAVLLIRLSRRTTPDP
ncbi:hypothetical protein acdb102_20970 [Acidothermaceae bacterium B102]|nr:hypothetical protein acdb102_20970 [Acidothermaceae bacterium B102]